MNNANLARYISFDKFENMCASGLFLANPTLFDDKQEGYIAVKNIFPGIDKRGLEKVEIMKSYFYISSWYAGIEESREMRNRYGEVRIETSWEQLKTISRSYGENNQTHNIIIGRIQYVNSADNGIGEKNPNSEWNYWAEKKYNPRCGYNLCSIKTLQGLFFKYDDYGYQKEVRLICDSFHGGNQGVAFKNDKNGVRIPLNANFFSRVVLSVDKLPLIKNRVENILRKYGYETEVIYSN